MNKPLTTLLLGALATHVTYAAETCWLDSLDLSKLRQSYGQPQTNRSMREKPLSISGKEFARGAGTHAHSTLWIDLGDSTERFTSFVGVDDAAGGGSVVFESTPMAGNCLTPA
jgi:hypothetical protein